MIGKLIAPAFRLRTNSARRSGGQSSLNPNRARLNLEPLADRVVPSAGSISGTVYQDVTGNGLTADDPGLGDVEMRLYRDSNLDGVLSYGDCRVGRTESADDGSYEFNWLRAGTYFVVEKSGSRLVRTAPVLDEYRTVELGECAQVAEQDFAFFRKIPRSAMDDFRFTIVSADGSERTVRNLRGNTEAGDTVIAHFKIEWWSRPVPVSLVSYTASGPEFDPNTASEQEIFEHATGTFGPGWHSLTVHIPNENYQIDFVLGPAIDQFGPAGSNIFYGKQCRLLSADNDGPEEPAPGGGISGRVIVDRDQNGVFDPAAGDSALGGVQVDLFATDANGGNTLVRSLFTNADGTYAFSDLAAGTFSVVERQPAGRPDGLDYIGDSGGADAGNDTLSGIVLATGQQAAGYVFTELAGRATFSGFVGLPNENVPEGFSPFVGESLTVTLQYVETDGSTITLTTQTNADDGSDLFEALGAGSYTIILSVPEGFVPTTRALLGTVDDEFEGEVVDGATITSIDLDFDSIGENYILLIAPDMSQP